MEEKNISLPILTIESGDIVEETYDKKEKIWHQIQNAYMSKRMLSGVLSGVENTENGSIAVVYYKDFRIVIPVDEMMLNLSDNSGYGDLKTRQLRILNHMLGCELDFIILGLDNKEKSVVASRKKAMEMKRKKFFLSEENPMITKNRIVQARIIAVAEKVVRIEVFGVECSVPAKNLSWEWVGDAREKFFVGDVVLVHITNIEINSETDIHIEADMKSITKNEVLEKLERCKIQGKYSGKITDIYKGIIFIKLDIGVNAIAHTCTDRRIPGKHDDITFVVNRLDKENGVAVGIITRIIRQNI